MHGIPLSPDGVSLSEPPTRPNGAGTPLRDREQLEALYDASPDMIFLHGPDGQLLDVNENTLRGYGYTRERMLSLPFTAFIATDYDPREPAERLRRALAGEAQDFEFRARRSDGSEFPVEVRLRRLGDKAGAARVLAVVRDLSARKQTEQALERRTAELSERMKELRCLYGVSHLLEHGADTLESLFQGVAALLPPGFQFPERTGARIRIGEREFVSDGFRAKGECLAVPLHLPEAPDAVLEVWLRPAGDQDAAYLEEERHLLSAVAEQLERALERRHAARVLRNSEARLAKAQRLAHLGCWEWDSVEDRIHWDEETRRIFGLHPGEEVTSYEQFLQLVHPDDRADMQRRVATSLERGSPQSLDYRIVQRDGEERFVHEEWEIQEADGGWRMIGTLQDITGRKRTEEGLRRNFEELTAAHRRLQEMSTQLVQAEKMSSVGQLAAGIAHEINNPVGYISANVGSLRGYLEDLLHLAGAYQDHEAQLNPAARGELARLREGIDLEFIREDAGALIRETLEGVSRVKGIVSDLKDFSRADEDEWQWADLHRGLDSTLNIVWNELKYKADVDRRYGELPPIQCLPAQLNQVFMNLLVNAGQAIAEQGHIAVASGREGERVWVRVSDNGSGIAPEHLPRLFEPFFTTKPAGTGTGLGLALSYGIVAKHGGCIEVESEPGRGSAFTVWLPIAQSGAAPSSEAIERIAGGGR